MKTPKDRVNSTIFNKVAFI